MLCPLCSGETCVRDSRPAEDSVRRRRECLACGHRFGTVEIDMEMYSRSVLPDREAYRALVDAQLTQLRLSLYQAYRI